MTGLTIERWGRASGLLLALLALALRLSAPTGWMLAPSDGHGAPRLVICTGHGTAEISPHPGAPTGDTGKPPDHPCAFSGVASPTPPSPPPVPSSRPAFAVSPAPVVAQHDQRPGLGLAAPPPPSHAPPTLA